MFRRLCNAQVPIEMARSVVAIADTGSFSKAGHALGLSQPAISSHVKRVQTIVGGPIFEKNNLGGVIFTPRGQSALALMRKLLDVNDQIASIGGADSGRQFLRIGVSVEYAPSLLQALSQTKRDVSVQVYANTSAEVAKGLNDGFLDVGCLYGDHLTLDHVIDEWDEAFAWARHPQFVTSPGEPIPLVCWPGSGSDGCVERCLEREGLAYRVAFASPDHLVRREAVTARVGVAGNPSSLPAITIFRNFRRFGESSLSGPICHGLWWIECGRCCLSFVLMRLRGWADEHRGPAAGNDSDYGPDVRSAREGIHNSMEVKVGSPGSAIRKRSIVVNGRKTSISVEDAFWEAIRKCARQKGLTISGLVAAIDVSRDHQNLSSAIRVYALEEQERLLSTLVRH